MQTYSRFYFVVRKASHPHRYESSLGIQLNGPETPDIILLSQDDSISPSLVELFVYELIS